MDDRIHVQIKDVDATTGIRIHMGEKAKFMAVAGTQSFHSAKRSGQKFSDHRW
jgi:hypothetical protein